jgi:hypothetical protein
LGITEADDKRRHSLGRVYISRRGRGHANLSKMPHQPTLTEIRITNINTCLTPALTLLNELNDAFGPPFVHLISNTILALISAVQVTALNGCMYISITHGIQDVKKNKEECLQLMENIHKVLYAIVELHIKSEMGPFPPRSSRT